MSAWIESTDWRQHGDEPVFDGIIGESWGQGRSTFGGVVAAGALRAASHLAPPDRTARSVQITFIGPIRPGPVTARCRVLRSGRTITYVSVDVVQGDHVCTTLQVVFGVPRTTALHIEPAPRDLPRRGPVPMPFVPGVTPTFTQHLDYRWTGGCAPFSGGDEPRAEGYVRLRQADQTDAAQLLALMDAWPPPAFGTLRRPAPGSTVTWQVDFMGPVPDLSDGGFCFYTSQTTSCREGYMAFEAKLYSEDGALVAVAQQLLAEFSEAV